MPIEIIKDIFHWKVGDILKVTDEVGHNNISIEIANSLIKQKVAQYVNKMMENYSCKGIK